MTVYEELTAWLDTHIPDGRRNKSRDTAMVLDFYGFGDTDYPTYQEIADRSGSLTRERVRQILNAVFRDRIDAAELPVSSRVAEMLDEVECLSLESIGQKLSSAGLIGEKASVRGLLNLAVDLGFCQGHDLYDCNLDRLSRNWSERDGVGLLVRQAERDRYKKLMTRARTLPGLHGLVTFDSLRRHLGDSGDTERVIQLIRSTPNVVVVTSDSAEWYLYEDRENTLISCCEKAFAFADQFEISRFVACMEGALYQRTLPFPRATQDVIRKWLAQSSLFEVSGDAVSMPAGEPQQLNGAEALVADYLSDGKAADFEEITHHSSLAEFSRPSISKACMKSPVVFVDKSGGRRHYRYQLISYAARVDPAQAGLDRYQSFKRKLQRAGKEGTDLPQHVVMRREQTLLREWVLGGKAIVRCAICGEAFSAPAIVAAHKKKRAVCTDAERTDPNIVFPLCTFGCDYLYETGALRIVEGKVVVQELPPAETADRRWSETLEGRQLEDVWLQGPMSYFAEVEL